MKAKYCAYILPLIDRQQDRQRNHLRRRHPQTIRINKATKFIDNHCFSLPITAGWLWGKVEKPRNTIYRALVPFEFAEIISITQK